MSKLETNQVDPATGTTLTLGTSGDTIAIPSGVTIANSGTATGFGETNTPAFFAYPSGTQTYAAANTKITLDTESFDTDSNFASDRFTPTTAGKYFIYGQIFIGSPGTSYYGNAYIWKNGGSEIWQGSKATAQNVDFSINVSAIISMNGSSDYLELYGYNNTSKTTASGSQFTYMTGYRLIGA